MLQVKYYNINIHIEFIHESFPAKFASPGIDAQRGRERERERLFGSFSTLSSLAGAETFLGLNLCSDGAMALMGNRIAEQSSPCPAQPGPALKQ